MMFSFILLTLFCTLLSFASGLTLRVSGAPSLLERNTTASAPIHFFLAGDSTTAPQAPGGGGWGAGFLSLLVPPSSGTNLGQNGATTVSFRQRGVWGKVLDGVKKETKEGEKKVVYVTIQFGHNDQKTDKGISVQDYRGNLVKMVGEVKGAGGVPILITPLTRRAFSGSKVADSLKDQRAATIAAAESSKTVVLDLNQASASYVNAIGVDASRKYNLKEGDTTHLNAEGSLVFGRMVADLLIEKIPSVAEAIKKDESMTAKIKAGKAV